jgi:hypothetical protein
MDPDRRRLGELTFREYVERFWKANPAAGDAGNLLALAARSQALVELAGGADHEGDLPVSRWAVEAGPSARALARQTLTEWAATSVPHEGATPAEIIAWRQVCQEALNMLAS